MRPLLGRGAHELRSLLDYRRLPALVIKETTAAAVWTTRSKVRSKVWAVHRHRLWHIRRMTKPATYVADLHGLDLLVRYQQNVHWLFINWEANAPREQNDNDEERKN
ncbi:MAG: hypothetical protein AUJ45_01580 [Parcubacteria group bacterium CG1_02_50_68]|nr:MAG: hypothetical protein AUJ45_01580 [Parcubacteria group bacterium CG1_02_50_68]